MVPSKVTLSSEYIFSLLGVKTEFENNQNPEDRDDKANIHTSAPTTVTLKAHRCSAYLDWITDFTGSPDLAQTFVVCCCLMGIKFKFTGLASF